MFSTLNRYAKPVSLRDIIALDEDDSIAIACRELLDNHPFFMDGRILDSRNKAISEKNNEFTTIITLYECNEQLLLMYIKSKDIRNYEGKKLNGTKKLKEYIRFRPNDQDIIEFQTLCYDFWTKISDSFEELRIYKEQSTPDSTPFRNRTGGSLFFRPTALLALVKASIILKENWGSSFEEVFASINKIPLQLNTSMWRNILWNPAKNTMITTNAKIVETLILYCIDQNVLNNKQIKNLLIDLQGQLQLEEDEVYDYLSRFVLK